MPISSEATPFPTTLRPLQSAKIPLAVAQEHESTQLADPFTSGLPTPPACPCASRTICDKSGGLDAVKAAVDIFCSKVLADGRIIDQSNTLQAQLKMQVQRDKQVTLLSEESRAVPSVSPALIFCIRQCQRVVMRVINTVHSSATSTGSDIGPLIHACGCVCRHEHHTRGLTKTESLSCWSLR